MWLMSLADKLMKKQQKEAEENKVLPVKTVNPYDMIDGLPITLQDTEHQEDDAFTKSVDMACKRLLNEDPVIINTPTTGTAYLVDSENMALAWVELLETLTDADKIYVFHTGGTHAPKLSFNELSVILGCGLLGEPKKNVEFITCLAGKNAVDMQICVMYGYLIAQNKYKKIEIISQDNGFEYGINMGNRLIEAEKRKTL